MKWKKLQRKLDGKKATGLDKIPGKLLNVAVDIVASTAWNVLCKDPYTTFLLPLY